MGTGGLQIVRFRGRYYIEYRPLDSYYKCMGAGIIKKKKKKPLVTR